MTSCPKTDTFRRRLNTKNQQQYLLHAARPRVPTRDRTNLRKKDFAKKQKAFPSIKK